MVTERTRRRCLERLDAMGGSAADLIEIRRAALEELRHAVGFDRWCAMLTDPETLVPWRALSEVDWWADTPRLNQISGTDADPNSCVSLVRTRRVADSLARVTGGDKGRSPVFREVLARYGCGDELRAAVTDRSGTWGSLHLFRSSDDRDFGADELALVRDASGLLAAALRSALTTVRRPAADALDATGVVLVDDTRTVLSRSAAADAWLERLNPEGIGFPDAMPGVVWAVVGALQSGAAPARVRVQTADGAWGVVEASRLGAEDAPIAITLRLARGPEVADLLTRAHGLTAREAEIAALVMNGATGTSIAERLVLSPHTVEDHIKSAMAKTGARNRRALGEALSQR